MWTWVDELTPRFAFLAGSAELLPQVFSYVGLSRFESPSALSHDLLFVYIVLHPPSENKTRNQIFLEMAHLAWRSARSSEVGTNDPSSTQLAVSSLLNVAESNGGVVSDGRASPAPGGTSSGVNGAQSNGEIGSRSSSDRTSTDTNRTSDSTPLQEPWWSPCIFGACTGIATRNDIELGTPYSGPDVFKMRELSNAEVYHLNRPQKDPYLRKLKCSRLFGDHIIRLKEWPKFFESTEKSSLELRDGFVTLWTTFIVTESLLAGVAVQPFIAIGPRLSGWQLDVYGLVWMLALIFDFMGVCVTAIFLGFLHGPPAKLSYFWLCNLGAWVGVPCVLVLLGALSSLVAIAYSSWVIYGYGVGIVCVFVAGSVVIFAMVASISLRKALTDAQALN